MPQPAQSTTDPSNDFLKASPILGTLALLAFVNWFVFFGVTMYLGGEALDTLPSKDGFVVTSHGHHKAVSESVWLFSLFYSSATLLISPLIMFLFAARHAGGKLKDIPWPLKLLICGFLLFWCVGWYSSIGSSLCRSVKDWQMLKR